MCQNKLNQRSMAREWFERCIALDGDSESDKEFGQQARKELGHKLA